MSGLSRREMLKRGAGVAGMVWAVPTVQTLGLTYAQAETTSGPTGEGTCLMTLTIDNVAPDLFDRWQMYFTLKNVGTATATAGNLCFYWTLDPVNDPFSHEICGYPGEAPDIPDSGLPAAFLPGQEASWHWPWHPADDSTLDESQPWYVRAFWRYLCGPEEIWTPPVQYGPIAIT